MEITIKSLKFDADKDLIAFIEKKVSKLARFGGEEGKAEVTLSLIKDPDNKKVQLHFTGPNGMQIIERNSSSFEDAINASVDAMKEALVRAKEKHQA